MGETGQAKKLAIQPYPALSGFQLTVLLGRILPSGDKLRLDYLHPSSMSGTSNVTE